MMTERAVQLVTRIADLREQGFSKPSVDFWFGWTRGTTRRIIGWVRRNGYDSYFGL